MTSFENPFLIKTMPGKSVSCRRCKSWDGKNDPLFALALTSKDTVPHSFRSGVLLKGPEKKHFSKAASDVMTAKTVKAINRLRSDSSLLKNYDIGDLESEMQSLRKKSHQLNEQYNKKLSPQPRPTVPGPASVGDTEESKTQSTEQIIEPKIEQPSNPIPESKMEKTGFSDKGFQTTVVGSPQNARKAEKPNLKKHFSKQSKSDAVLPTIKQVPSVGYGVLSMSMPQLPKTHFVPVQFCSAPSTTIQRTSSLSALQRPSVGFNISFAPITKDEVEGKIVGSGAFTPVSTLISNNDLSGSSGAAFGKSKSLSNLLSKKPPTV